MCIGNKDKEEGGGEMYIGNGAKVEGGGWS